MDVDAFESAETEQVDLNSVTDSTPKEGLSVEIDIDSVIDRLLAARASGRGTMIHFPQSDIVYLCTRAREIFLSQSILLELEPPIKVYPPRNAANKWPLELI
jgi:hypothetical protein